MKIFKSQYWTESSGKSLCVIWSLLLIFIILAGSYFRLFKLGQIPQGLYADEVSYAYNAYSLEKTGNDEWGVSRPLFLKAFGDYKPALLSYMQILAFKQIGHTATAVRLPGAILGILSLLAFGWVIWKMTKNKLAAFLGMALMTASPWHIHYSRAAMDPIMGFSFLIIGIALLMVKNLWIQSLGVICLILSMYTYNAERAFVPLLTILVLILGIFNHKWRQIIRDNKYIFFSIIIGASLFILYTFTASYNTRALAVLAINYPELNTKVNDIFFRTAVVGIPTNRLFNNKLILVLKDFSERYMAHWSLMFLFFDENISPRHAFSHYGNLLFIVLPLLLFGIFKNLKNSDTYTWFMLGWLLLAPIPAALSTDVPHSGRALIMLVPIIYFASLGGWYLTKLGTSRIWQVIIAGGIFILLLINTALYWRDYLIFFPEESEAHWNGYEETLANYLESEISKTYNKIYVSAYGYNQELFFAWYWLFDPEEWQESQGNHQINNLNIVPISNEKLGCLLLEANALVVTKADENYNKMAMPNHILTARNRFYNPPAVFYIYDTNKLDHADYEVINANCQNWQATQTKL